MPDGRTLARHVATLVVAYVCVHVVLSVVEVFVLGDYEPKFGPPIESLYVDLWFWIPLRGICSALAFLGIRRLTVAGRALGDVLSARQVAVIGGLAAALLLPLRWIPWYSDVGLLAALAWELGGSTLAASVLTVAIWSESSAKSRVAG